MRILWIGPIFTDDLLRRYPAALSPAGVRWNRNLADALIAQGVELLNLYHLPDTLWPRGRIRISEPVPRELLTQYQSRWVPYWNVPNLRSASLAWGYSRALVSIKESLRPDVVITYNFLRENVAVGSMARRCGLAWVNILADVYGRRMDLQEFERVGSVASGHVILSWSAYQNAPWREKFHLDGGVNCLSVPEGCEPGLIVYTGSLNALGGIELLAQAFPLVRHPHARLVVCGKGQNKVLEQLASRDSRVSILGLVSDQCLIDICGRASVLVNPRPTRFEENRLNFPSKLMEYLSYRKPVVSTWTAGLAPVYRSVLEVVERESPVALAATLDSVLAWTPERRAAFSARVREFVTQGATWQAKAAKLRDWLGNINVTSVSVS